MSVERLLDMDKIVELVCAKGHAAYVEQTGGGTATIYASREWEARPVYVRGDQANLPTGVRQYPKARDEEGRYEVAAGPGWFEGPGWSEPKGAAGDFVIGVDDNGESEAEVCNGDEQMVAGMIVACLEKGINQELAAS
jgi:hypothetical protein